MNDHQALLFCRAFTHDWHISDHHNGYMDRYGVWHKEWEVWVWYCPRCSSLRRHILDSQGRPARATGYSRSQEWMDSYYERYEARRELATQELKPDPMADDAVLPEKWRP